MIDIAAFLEKLKAIAQDGLFYSKDSYDLDRYRKLQELVVESYAGVSMASVADIRAAFEQSSGWSSPKVGTDAAIFDEGGKILLMRRHDDGLWSLPCGWAEVGETAREAIEREVLEETGLVVRAGAIIDATSRLAGEWGQAFTTYHLLFHCVIEGGALRRSGEALDVGFFDPTGDIKWHKDHQSHALTARRHHLSVVGAVS